MAATKHWMVSGGGTPLAWHNRLLMWYTVTDLQNVMAEASGNPDFDVTKMPPELLESIAERLIHELDDDLINSIITAAVKVATYEVLNGEE